MTTKKIEILVGKVMHITSDGSHMTRNHYQVIAGDSFLRHSLHTEYAYDAITASVLTEMKRVGSYEYSIKNGELALTKGFIRIAIDPMSDEDIEKFVALLEKRLAMR